MDPSLLRFYERELQFIKEMGAEYAEEFPKIAGRLGIDGTITSDPYVERLYEGFAFLAARIQLRLDAEYPKFTQNLLNIIYPQYLTPTPSMTIVQFELAAKGGFEAGADIPRHTSLRAPTTIGDQTGCIFQTAHPVKLWPIKIKEAEYFTNVGAVSDLILPGKTKAKAGLRIVVSTTGEQSISDILMNSLSFHLTGHSGQAFRIYEQLFGRACGLFLRSRDTEQPWSQKLPMESLAKVGFSDEESLFPVDNRTFSGYRLLREYFAFPERFLFFEIENIGKQVERCQGSELELVVLFDKLDPELEKLVIGDDFGLFCSPAINLFPKRADRIHLSRTEPEFHVVPDRTKPQDYEIFQIDSIVGYGTSEEDQERFESFYSITDASNFAQQKAFYTSRRDRRVLSAKQRRTGPRSSYIGSEVFVALVDANEAPFSNELKQLEVKTHCTNRDLPLRMSVGKSTTDFEVEINAPVSKIRCVKGPTPPRPSLAHNSGEIAWRLINQLSMNFLSFVQGGEQAGASTLREMLQLYADKNDASTSKQIEGIVSIRSEQIIRRIPTEGPITFGKGLKLIITCEEAAFTGSGMFLLGAILEQFFSRYVSINSFTEVAIRSDERGEIMQWQPRAGQRTLA